MADKKTKLARKDQLSPQNLPEALDPEDQETPEDSGLVVTDGLTSKNAPNTLDSVVKQFLQRYELLDQGYTCTLYKYDNPLHGKTRAVIWQGTDEIKTEAEIGLQYGGGRYVLMVNAVTPDGSPKIATKNVHIHALYDSLKYEEDRKQFGGDNRQVVIAGGNGGDLNNALNVMEKIIALMLPLIVTQRQAQPDFSEVMSETYRSVNKTMRQMLLDNSQLFNDLQRDNFEMGEVVEDESEVTGIQGIINTLAPILENVLPLLTGGGQRAAATVQTVKALPLFRELTKTKANLKALVYFIDKKHGKETTEKLLSKFKIKRPK